jgi:Winged helix DNA-binding domain
MTPADVIRLRLANQRIAQATFKKPSDVVAWFGAVQAQDYLGSLWALGLRMARATEASVEAAEAQRAIIRTWPMRGTLHFVTPADARWMLKLLTPRVVARNAKRLKKEVDVDEAVLARSEEVVVRALAGGKRLPRNSMYELLESARIKTGKMRGLHILMGLAQQGTLCLAGREGKQHTFALLDDWAPNPKSYERDAALAELARRYFTSHGPATAQDFMWWAGITAKDAQAAIDSAKRHLVCERIAERPYWLSANAPDSAARPGKQAYGVPRSVAARGKQAIVASAPHVSSRLTLRAVGSSSTFTADTASKPSASTDRSIGRAAGVRMTGSPAVSLLPAFDEYTVAYKDRSLLLEIAAAQRGGVGFGILGPVVVIDGRVVGAWKRKLAKGGVRVETQLFRPLNRAEKAGLAEAIQRYASFLGLDAS